MSDAIIESAILAHRNWVTQFRNSIQGRENEPFDVSRAFDDTVCILGKWLLGDAQTMMEPEQYSKIVLLHKHFHEIAGQIAILINRRADSEDIVAMFAEFDLLSKELVKLLLASKLYPA